MELGHSPTRVGAYSFFFCGRKNQIKNVTPIAQYTSWSSIFKSLTQLSFKKTKKLHFIAMNPKKNRAISSSSPLINVWSDIFHFVTAWNSFSNFLFTGRVEVKF